MKIILRWSLKRLVKIIVKTLSNKFDFFLIIEGNRGLGKSTLAYHIARAVAKEFKKEGSKNYQFKPMKCLLYSKKEFIAFLHKWQASGIADEMINVTFNRDFYNEDQKNIIKMINMNRDHGNLIIACVPEFKNLDNQIKNLAKMRISIVRRGIAVIQTPNRSIYSKDKWDQAINEKIERSWIEKGVKNPKYTKLTTFRGILKYPKLSEKQEAIYQRVKDEKRNIIAKEQMGIEEEKENDPVALTIERLFNGEIKNGALLHGIGIGAGMDPYKFENKIRRELRKMGKSSRLSEYYWEKKAKKEESDGVF